VASNNASHINLKGNIMTTKTTKTVKTVKPAVRSVFNAVSKAKEAGSIEANRLTSDKTSKAAIQAIANELRKHKILVGTLSQGLSGKCAVMGAFAEELIKGNFAESTVKNRTTAFRQAVNDGKAYDENSARKNGARTAKGGGSDSAVKLTIRKDADLYDVAQGLREAINSDKFRDQYAELAAFLTDALDEFEGQ